MRGKDVLVQTLVQKLTPRMTHQKNSKAQFHWEQAESQRRHSSCIAEPLDIQDLGFRTAVKELRTNGDPALELASNAVL